METQHLISISRLCEMLLKPYPYVMRAIQELSIQPALSLDERVYFDASAFEQIQEFYRNPKER